MIVKAKLMLSDRPEGKKDFTVAFQYVDKVEKPLVHRMAVSREKLDTIIGGSILKAIVLLGDWDSVWFESKEDASRDDDVAITFIECRVREMPTLIILNQGWLMNDEGGNIDKL